MEYRSEHFPAAGGVLADKALPLASSNGSNSDSVQES